MKKIVVLLFSFMILIVSCSDNPVQENQSIDMTNTWSLAFKSSKPYLLTGDAWGKTLTVGYGDFSNCSFIRMKVNYISYYRDYCKPPSIGVTGFPDGILWQTKYSTLDTIIKRFGADSLMTIGLYAINAKVYIDSVVIMKGYSNFY